MLQEPTSILPFATLHARGPVSGACVGTKKNARRNEKSRLRLIMVEPRPRGETDGAPTRSTSAITATKIVEHFDTSENLTNFLRVKGTRSSVKSFPLMNQ